MGKRALSIYLFIIFVFLNISIFGQSGPAELMWDANDPADGVKGYNVYRSEQSGSGYTRINDQLVTGTSYLDTTAPTDRTSYYVCTAVNGEDLESGFSNEVPFPAASGNSPPIAANDEVEILQGEAVTITVLVNDEDPDLDQLTVVEATQGEFGSVVINGDNTVTYTPLPTFTGTDSFVYIISDGNGGTDEATVWIAVIAPPPPPNDPPNAVDDVISTQEDTPVVVFVLSNDNDPNEDPLIVQGTTHGERGWVTIVENGGAVQYFPDDDFFGEDSFTYSINDGRGGVAEARVTVTVAGVNDPPHAGEDETTTIQGEPVTIAVLSNDSDVDEDALSITGTGPAQNGTIKINQDQTITYTPNSEFTGEDSFTYTISDGAGGTATTTVFIHVIESNDPPTARPDEAETNEDEPVLIQVLGNDSDPDQDLLVVIEAGQGTHGSTEIVEAGAAIRYTPNQDYSGTDTFVYTVSDGKEGVAEAEVTVIILPVNDAPIARDDEAFTQINQPVTILVLANDFDADEDPLEVTEVGQSEHGTVTINPDSSLTYTPESDFIGEDTFTYSITDGNDANANGTVLLRITELNEPPTAVADSVSTPEDVAVVVPVLTNDTDPDDDPLVIREAGQAEHGSVEIIDEGKALRYSPSEDYFGADSFVYSITDGKGGSASTTVTIEITSVNDPPLAVDDSIEIENKSELSIQVLINDSDVENDILTIIEVTQPSQGQVTHDGSVITYNPHKHASGSDSFRYTISDGNDATASAQVRILFSGENSAPVAVKDQATAKKDKSINIDLLFNDSDPDNDVLTIVDVTEPVSGKVVLKSARAVTYTPARGFLGQDSFEYSVSDGKASSKARVEVKVVNRFSKGRKLAFPAYVETGDPNLANTFVGVGLLNSAYQTDYISVGGVNSEGEEVYNVQLGEPLLPRGQTDFLAEEAIDLTQDPLTLTAEGIMGELQGFFMVGSRESSRLDGVGSELTDSSQLYFPLVHQTESDSTLLYFINRDPDSEVEFILSLHDETGSELQSVDGTLAPSGAFLGTVDEIFGDEVQMEEGYIQATSVGSSIAGFELVANQKSMETLAGTSGISAKEFMAPQFFVDPSTGSTSILRLLNLGNWKSRVKVEAFDDDSNLLVTQEYEIGSRELLVADLKDLFEDTLEDMVTGFLRLEVGGLIGSSSKTVGSITFSGFEGRSSTTLPLVEEGSTELIFPHVAQTAESSIYTGFSILNPNEETATVRIEAFDERGLRTALKQFQLDPGKRAIDLLRSETFFGNDFQQMEGHIRIRSTAAVVAFAIFGDYQGNFMSAIQGQERLY